MAQEHATDDAAPPPSDTPPSDRAAISPPATEGGATWAVANSADMPPSNVGPEGEATMRQARFQLASGDRNVGTVYLPEGRQGRGPALVVCFGSASDQKPNPFTAELCARGPEAGLAVVTFDVYGWGETGGNPDGWTYGRWAANLADVCRWVATQAWADGRRVGAIGTSAGSTAVLRCAIDTTLLAFGVSVATFLGHFTVMPDGPAKQLVAHLDTLVAGGTIETKGRGSSVWQRGLDFFKGSVGGAPIYRLHTITCPIFFLQGGADNPYRRSDARLGYELRRSHGLPAAYQEIAAGDHVLGNVPREAADAVLAWLREIAFLR